MVLYSTELPLVVVESHFLSWSLCTSRHLVSAGGMRILHSSSSHIQPHTLLPIQPVKQMRLEFQAITAFVFTVSNGIV